MPRSITYAPSIGLALVGLLACGSSSATAPPEPVTEPKPERTEASKREPAEPKVPGFDVTRRQLKELVLEVNAHIIVLKSQATFGEYRDVLKTVAAHAQVTSAAPFIFTEVIGRSDRDDAATTSVEMAVKALDPSSDLRRLERYIVRGSMHTLATASDPPAIVLGDGLAKRLGVDMGDKVRLATVPDPWQVHLDAGVPSSGVFLVGGIYRMAFDEYDARLAFTTIASMQALLGRGDQVMGIEARVKDLKTSDKVVEDLTRALGGMPYHVQDWFELNRAVLETRD